MIQSNIILEINNIAEVTVYSEKNSIMGNIVCAKVRLIDNQDKIASAKMIKSYCLEKLERFKVPVKIELTNQEQYSGRFKKDRLISN